MAKNEQKANQLPAEQIQIFTDIQQQALDEKDYSKLTSIIRDYKINANKNVKQIYEIDQNLRLAEYDHELLIQRFRNDKQEGEDRVEQLKQILEEGQLAFEQQKEDRQEKKRVEIDQLRIEKEQEMQQYQSQEKQLLEEIAPLQINEEKEKLLDGQIDELKQRKREGETNFYNQMQNRQKKITKQRHNISSISTAQIDDIQQSAPQMEEKNIKLEEENRIDQNFQLKRQLAEHQRMVESLKKERDIMLEHNQNYKMNKSVNQQGIIQYQQLSRRQLLQIKKLKEQVQKLQNTISEEVSQATQKLEIIQYQHNMYSGDLKKGIETLKFQLQNQTIELRRIRLIAQHLVSQRMEIENFFLNSLQDLRQQIKASQQITHQRSNQSNSSSLKLPEISKLNSSNNYQSQMSNLQENKDQNSKFYQQKVDISELDLQEKDKLLRILYSKLNLGVLPLPWPTVAGGSDLSKINPEKSLPSHNQSQYANN